MRSDWCGCMPVSAQWGLSLEFPFFPNQFIVCVQNNEVVYIGWRNKILLSSGSRVYAPASEENDIWATNICSMTVTRKRRGPRNPNSGPLILLSVQNSDIIQIAGLKLSSLPKASIFLTILIEIKSSLNDHIGSHLNSSVSLPRWG